AALPPEQDVEAYRRDLAAHAKEPVDRSWAPAAEKAFASDLRALAPKAKYRVESVSCRMTTCLADLTFDSFGDATHGWQSILSQPYRTNCGREIMLETVPSDATKPYGVQL